MRAAHALSATAMAFFLTGSLHGSDEAAKMLKVPAVSDRPVNGTNGPSGVKTAVPQVSPVPAPAADSPGPATDEKTTSVAAADPIAPEPFPLSRYAMLWENSPFQNESIAPPQQSEALAQRFVLGGILREKGEYRVWVRERATQKSHQVTKDAPNKEIGVSLVEVVESPDKQSDASATIKLGAEVGVIKFDSAGTPGLAVPGAPAPQAMAPRPFPPAQPVGIPAPQPAVAPQGSVAAQQPAVINPPASPGAVPPVPAPGVTSVQGQQGLPGQNQMPPPRVIRRRAIVPAAP